MPFVSRCFRSAVSSTQVDFALTQTLTIREQLEAGARFLDVRVSKRVRASGDERFWTVHGLVLCVPLEQVISQINEFHQERDKIFPERGPDWAPVVIVVRTYFLDHDEELLLAEYIRHALQHPVYDACPHMLRRIPTAALPHNILAGVSGSRLPVDWGRDAWLDTYSAEKKIAFLEDTMEAAEVKEYRDSLFVLGWTVTPSVVDVTLSLLSGGWLRRAVRDEAQRVNARFPSFLKQNAEDIDSKCNVVFFDCFTEEHTRILRNFCKSAPQQDS